MPMRVLREEVGLLKWVERRANISDEVRRALVIWEVAG